MRVSLTAPPRTCRTSLVFQSAFGSPGDQAIPGLGTAVAAACWPLSWPEQAQLTGRRRWLPDARSASLLEQEKQGKLFNWTFGTGEVADMGLLEGDREIAVTRQGNELRLTIPSVEVHEVIALDLA